jgi:hypothetical protein
MHTQMNPTLESYRGGRDKFLADVVEVLSADDRFVAAWLTGSFSRNEEDALSDLDLSLVVSDAHSADLCARHDQVSAQTSSQRYALVSKFGVPALVHENNHNAPEGGTFTFVLYEESAIMVDWILIPQSKAKQPQPSQLLFDKVGIPVLPAPEPEELEQRKKSVAEQWAFFWMMTAVTIKYIHRKDGVFAAEWIENLNAIVSDVERQLRGESRKHKRGSRSQLQTTARGQIKSLKQLCKKMQELKPEITDFTGAEPQTPDSEIELLFSLVKA